MSDLTDKDKEKLFLFLNELSQLCEKHKILNFYGNENGMLIIEQKKNLFEFSLSVNEPKEIFSISEIEESESGIIETEISIKEYLKFIEN